MKSHNTEIEMFDIKIMLAGFGNSAIKQLVMKELLSDRKEKRNSH